MTDDIVARLRRYKRLEFYPPICGEAADEIERLRMELNESRREICLLRAPSTIAGETADNALRAFYDSRGWSIEELAALRGTPSDGEASASEGSLNTGASVQTENAEG